MAPASTPASNARFIRAEVAWFSQFLDLRLKQHAGEPPHDDLLEALPPPRLPKKATPYSDVLRELKLQPPERLLLVLAYLPHVQPAALDPLFIRNQALDRRFTEFGGLAGSSHGGFLPTGETALFLLAGEDLSKRLSHHRLFHPEHPLLARRVLRLERRHPDEPPLSAALQLTPEYLERLTTGGTYQPPFGPEFPAQRITTLQDWDDLVLDGPLREDLEDIITWARHQETLMDTWGLRKQLKPGYRSLFHGPPGTGKTLTASLLGKATGMPVFRVDLSKVVSKYIGETEKNLASLFDHAQLQRWILFFDEADSLFGKRTESRNANDHAANQQISYLLQRIEDFPGIALLASNQRTHFDEAFARRFQSMIHFPMPGPAQRLRLWEACFRDKPFTLASDVNLPRLAREHELSGGAIINVLRHACLRAIVREPQEIRAQDLLHGISRELHKEGRYSLPGR
ncbi:ATP-binding protein [Myxococcus qinghaiensis]|uniref:ATP-binding protein n=1 Tax=Myxococcus qinghaiensis TaxID=2906758 RepID=UPI0020A7CA25|nr:ATP-binding protein [Myxococcus qinghaiensis]MCP3166775.1 ATP-binding protein [Myxococcus qinghaiensis]